MESLKPSNLVAIWLLMSGVLVLKRRRQRLGILPFLFLVWSDLRLGLAKDEICFFAIAINAVLWRLLETTGFDFLLLRCWFVLTLSITDYCAIVWRNEDCGTKNDLSKNLISVCQNLSWLNAPPPPPALNQTIRCTTSINLPADWYPVGALSGGRRWLFSPRLRLWVSSIRVSINYW